MIGDLILATNPRQDMEGNDLITQPEGLQFDPEPWIHHDPDQDKTANKNMNEQE